MLSGEGKEAGDAQGDSGRNGLGFDPKADPAHDDNETSGDVSVEEIIAQTSLKHEDYFQTSELA